MTIRNLLIAFIILALTAFTKQKASAQCTPDSQFEIYNLGVFPFPFNPDPDNPNVDDSLYVGVTDTVFTGEPWSMTFTAIVPDELDFGGIPTDMEYVRVEQVNGLPPGFDYECSAMDCIYEPGTHCFLVSGTTWVPGSYDITVDIWAKMAGIQELAFLIPPDPADNGLGFPEGSYTAVVVSLTNITETAFENGTQVVYPNPFQNELSLSYNSIKASDVSINVSDLSGKIIYTEVMKSSTGLNSLSLQTSSWSDGLYIYEITDGFSAIQGKIIKE